MFSFHRFRRNVATLFIVFCLFTALLFTGCETEPDEGFGNEIADLIGTWEGEYDDGYTITATTLKQYQKGEYPSEATGTIKYVSNFTDAAGVIIIQWNGTDSWGGDENKFIGVYYKNLKPGISLEMGTASLYPDSAGKDTLDEAKEAFTMGNEGTYMSYYGAYTKQQ